jgi:hypothetical protein
LKEIGKLLHEGSMMAQEVVIREGKTLRFNLSINKSFRNWVIKDSFKRVSI